jgi:hypothetical protein
MSLSICVGDARISIQPASVEVLDWNRGQIDAFETANVDTPEFWSRARAAERQNAAVRAEVIFGGFRVPLIERKLFDRGQKTKALIIDAMEESAAPAADRAVANPDVVEIRVDLEPNFTAVARSCVRLLHFGGA